MLDLLLHVFNFIDMYTLLKMLELAISFQFLG